MFFLSLIASCTSDHLAPVYTRNTSQTGKAQAEVPVGKGNTVKSVNKAISHHVVSSGDTLYSIAWNYNLDYREIARWNEIGEPYLIHPKQLIRLTAPVQVLTRPKKTTEKKLSNIKNEIKKIAPDQYSGEINWQWPTMGRLSRSNSPIAKKGINILGKNGQSIKTAAPGMVVYSGGGVLGYGKLIIIKHNTTYLSAYAHNSKLMVREGDNVLGGQQIAKMGQDSTGQVLLHFEIRKDGQPTNPINYLPAIN